MESQDKLPLNIMFEIVQHPAPNDRWYDVTPIISWEETGFLQRMDTSLCLKDEISENKEAVCLLIGEHFTIQEVS
jgi:hypothetical protein